MAVHVDSRVKGASVDSRANAPANVLQGPKGERGEQGPAGPCGPQGEPSNIPGPKVQLSIGRVVAGEVAAAAFRDDGDAQVLDLVLPRGAEGQRGLDSQVPGPKGDSIVGPKGSAGKDAPSFAEIRALVEELLASEEIRKTFKGDRGDTGPTSVATVQVGTTTTVSPETPASVVNAGTANAVVLNFAVPQGVAGATGATGASVEGPEGRPGKNCDKEFVQDIVLAILKRNNLIR